MKYDEFNEKTKLYINKAMDLYYSIKEKDIVQYVSRFSEGKNYKFTKTDKKILSLFIAGYMVEEDLKDILSEYDDIKLQDLLSFADIETKEIKKLADEEYSEFYQKYFQLDLISIMKEKSTFYDINFITPEVIIWCLGEVTVNESDILNYFCAKYDIGSGMWFHDHPLFKALKNYNLINGSISEKNFSKGNNLDNSSSMFDFSPKKQSMYMPKEQPQKSKLTSTDFNADSIWLILDEIQKKFIGQEEAVEGLFYNIVNNQQLAQNEEMPDGQRSIIFLDGPTGTGKTAINREITEKLGIPFTATSVTNYSSTGYVGGDITDVLKELYKKANGDIEKAQRGIVIFDEFDKIAYSRSGGLEMKRAVQQQLLDFLGGGKYTIRVGNSIFDMKEFEFDTSKLTFVCLGALTDLRQQKIKPKQSIGFGQPNLQGSQQDYTIKPQDLMGIGLERELVGRFNTYIHTNDYSRESLIKILRNSTISPLIGFKQWIESRGKKLEIDEDVYDIIADQAYELNTGARSLQTIVNNIRTPFIKEVLRGTSQIIHLDSETVIKVGEQAMNRKGRA